MRHGLGSEGIGGAVLTDGYLAAGSLSREQAPFVSGWGVLLQLADDLQDVRQDCEDGCSLSFLRLPFEAFLQGDDGEPAFPLLPSSLMPRL